MSKLRTLALDCATATGFAHNTSWRPASGVVRFDVKRGESPGMRFLRFREWLTLLVTDLQPDLIVFERPERFKSGAAAEVCLGLTTRVQEVAAQLGVEHTPVGPSTLKKWATGDGNAKKPAMIAEACRRSGRTITDDNEADAVLILEWALAGRPDPKQAVAREKAQQAAAAEAERRARTLVLLWDECDELLHDLKGATFAGARDTIRKARAAETTKTGFYEGYGAAVTITFTAGQWAKFPDAIRQRVAP